MHLARWNSLFRPFLPGSVLPRVGPLGSVWFLGLLRSVDSPSRSSVFLFPVCDVWLCHPVSRCSWGFPSALFVCRLLSLVLALGPFPSLFVLLASRCCFVRSFPLCPPAFPSLRSLLRSLSPSCFLCACRRTSGSSCALIARLFALSYFLSLWSLGTFSSIYVVLFFCCVTPVWLISHYFLFSPSLCSLIYSPSFASQGAVTFPSR